MTGTGDVTLTTPGGETVTVRSQAAWDAALDGKITGVAQTSSTDAMADRILKLTGDSGSFGLGGVAVRMPTESDVAAYLRTMPSGLYAVLASASTSNLPGTVVIGQGYLFRAIKFNANPIILIIAQCVTGGIWYGMLTPTAITWRQVWDSNNLIKQTAFSDATVGSVMINGAHGLGGLATATLLTNLNTTGAVNGFFKYASSTSNAPTTAPGFGISFGYDNNSQMQLVCDANTDALYFRRKSGGAWGSSVWHQLSDLNSAQTFSGVKTFTGAGMHIMRAGPTLSFVHSGTADGVIGKSIIAYNAGSQLQFLHDPSQSSSTGRITISLRLC